LHRIPQCVEVIDMNRGKFAILIPLLLVMAACSRDPKVQAQRYLENGNKFFAKNKFKEASIMYRRAQQKDLRFGEAYYRLGLTYLKLAAYTDAAKSLVRAVELQPNNTDAATKLADLYLVASTQDAAHRPQLVKEASDLAEKLIAQNANSFDGHRLRGQVAMLNNDAAAAAKELGAANSIRPNQADVIVAYFQALVGNKQTQEAEKIATDLIAKEKSYAPMYDLLYLYYTRQNQLDKAEQLLKLKSANNPQNADYILQLAAHYFLAKRRPDMDAQMRKLADARMYPQGRLYAGDFYFFRLREFENAQHEYEEGAKANPKEKTIYDKRLVELLATTGKNAEADQLLAEILKNDPKDADAIAMRAALMLTTGNRDQVNMAANDLQGLVTKTPTNHLLRFNLARALLAKGEMDQARLQLEEAVKIRTDFVVARELLARIFLAKGDPARALREAEGVLTFDKSNLQAHLIKSSALLSMNDKDKARTELEYITRTYPQNPDARFQVGLLAWQDKDYHTAERVFGELHKENPKDIRGLVGVVETLASQDRMADAIAEMQKSVKAEPNRNDLRLTLGNLYVRSEQYDEAIAIYKELSAQDPKSADLLFRLGETYRRKGELNTAMEKFRQSSQAAPSDPTPLLQLGLMMDGTGKRDQAKPIYEQILKIDPGQPVALNNLAFIKAEEGNDLDQALTMAQRARQKLPNSTDVADTLGWIYIKKNLSEDAIRVFTDLIQKEPKNPTFRYHFGMALMQKGDKAAAKRELEMAIRNNPSRDEAGKIQELLKGI
jgi:tetratricopeptide (TPR) repeat protein